MSKACPNCGFENPDNASKCQACGSALPAFEKTEPSQGGEMKGSILKGLSNIRIGMIFIILAFIVGFVIIFAITGRFDVRGFFLFGGLASTSLSTKTLTSALEISSLIIIVSSIFTLVSVYFFRSGFSSLERVNMRFGTGKTGSTAMFIGYILFIIAYVAIIAAVVAALAGNPPGAAGYLILALVFLVIGGLMVFVGLIMICIGLFRIGSVFNQDSSKIGAILFFFLSIVGAIIMLLSTGSIIKKVGGGGSPGSPSEIGQPPV